MEIKNKIALVTGGASGIGFAYVKELLKNEAGHVAILDLENSKGEEAAQKLKEEFGRGRVIFIVCDVTKPQELKDAFAKTVKEFGGLDIVINNAGIMDDSRWQFMINLNLNAVVEAILLSFEYMGTDKGGHGGTIVNIASIAGLVPSAPFPIYGATKHAIIGLSRSFGDQFHYEKKGVRILTLCPGVTDTQLITKSPGRTLKYVNDEEITKGVVQLTRQTTESVAQGMIHILRVGENGSVWVAQHGQQAFAVEFSDMGIWTSYVSTETQD